MYCGAVQAAMPHTAAPTPLTAKGYHALSDTMDGLDHMVGCAGAGEERSAAPRALRGCCHA